jgi:hypothetical protein
MQSWTRGAQEQLCGGCGAQLAIGDPLKRLTIGRIVKVRCERCVGPAPADLPPLPARTGITPTLLMRPTRGVPMLPLDWKARSTGEREPGEEG